MSNKKLTILGVVAIVMLLWAVFQSKIANRTFTSSTRVPAPVIQGLNPDKIGKISVSSPSDSVTLKRTPQGFSVAEEHKYPAQTSKINNLITTALDIKTGELITQNAENFFDLGVKEDEADIVVKFFEESGKLITGVIAGRKNRSRGGYVREVNSNKVFACQKLPRISSSAMDYIDKTLIQIDTDNPQDSSRITQVEVTEPNGTYTLVSEPNSSEINLLDIPSGKKLRDSVAKRVFNALSNLSFTDVQKSVPGLEYDYQYLCRQQNELEYTLRIGRKDDKYYLKGKAEFTGPEEIYKAAKTESEEELKDKEAKLLAIDEARKFNNKCTGWIYEISDYKAKNLTKPLDELLEDIVEEKPEEETSDSSE